MQGRRGSASDGQGTPLAVKGVPPFAIRGRTWRSSLPEGDVLQGARNSPDQKGKEAVSVGIRGP